ncbi:MAG: hypothetical protein QOJ35_1909 [Solirubrobacteraceae bacterium]|nr:hypothetical protein [Solirubrobacteraceae bacterium]
MVGGHERGQPPAVDGRREPTGTPAGPVVAPVTMAASMTGASTRREPATTCRDDALGVLLRRAVLQRNGGGAGAGVVAGPPQGGAPARTGITKPRPPPPPPPPAPRVVSASVIPPAPAPAPPPLPVSAPPPLPVSAPPPVPSAAAPAVPPAAAAAAAPQPAGVPPGMTLSEWLAATPDARAAVLRALDEARIPPALRTLAVTDERRLRAMIAPGSAAIDTFIDRAIKFVAHAPTQSYPVAPTAITPALNATGTLGKGKVDVATFISFKSGLDPARRGFSMTYTGPDADSAHWLQFIWREIVKESASGAQTRLAADVVTKSKTLAGTIVQTSRYALTTNPAAPVYRVDTLGSHSPFYGDSGVALAGMTAATIYDAPSAQEHLALSAFKVPVAGAGAPAPAPARVLSRAHFVTYLVFDMAVAFRVNLTVEWTYDKVTQTGRQSNRMTVVSMGSASAIDADQRAALLATFPGAAYLA